MAQEKPQAEAKQKESLQTGPSWLSVGAVAVIGVVIMAMVMLGFNPFTRANTQVNLSISADVYRQGEMLFQQSCAECHGVGGEGYAKEGVPAPPLNGSAHAWHHSDEQILNLIKNGGTRMPAVAKDWKENDVEAVWSYVKQWWSPIQRKSQQGSIGE